MSGLKCAGRVSQDELHLRVLLTVVANAFDVGIVGQCVFFDDVKRNKPILLMTLPLLSTSTQEPLEVGLSVCTMAHQVERSVNRFNMDKGVA